MYTASNSVMKLDLGHLVHTIYQDEARNIPIAAFDTRTTGMCCGERRIGNFWYTFHPTDRMGMQAGPPLTDAQLEPYLLKLLSCHVPAVPFVRGNLNTAYPLWDKALLKFGFQVIMKWQNRVGGSYMTEYALVQRPLDEFRKEKNG